MTGPGEALDAGLWEIEAQRFQDEIELLRADLEALVKRVDAAGVEVEDGLAARLEQVVVLVDEHEKTLGELTARAKKDKGPAPWAWAHLDEESAASRRWELAQWVNWWNDRFRPSARYVIPRCWPRHGAAEEILTGMWEAWKAAYLTGGPGAAPSNAPADFLILRMHPLLDLLFDVPGWLKGCTPTEHQPVPEAPPQLSQTLFEQMTAEQNDAVEA